MGSNPAPVGEKTRRPLPNVFSDFNEGGPLVVRDLPGRAVNQVYPHLRASTALQPSLAKTLLSIAPASIARIRSQAFNLL